MKPSIILRAAFPIVLSLCLGCGSDSDPEFFPQVLFRIEAQGGGGCFHLDELASRDALHEVESGRLFTLADGGRFTFLLANAAPPYRARFGWVAGGACPDSSGRLEVTGFEVQGPSSDPQFLDALNLSAVVELRQDVGGTVSTETESTRVRFVICAPASSEDDCADGSSGRRFTGTVGDAFSSHILRSLEDDDAAATPAIIFLEDARDRVSGLFRGERGQLLRGELFVNERLQDSRTSTGDVVLAEDL